MKLQRIPIAILGSALAKAPRVARRNNFCVFAAFKLLLILLISTGWRQEAPAQEAGEESNEPSPFVITDRGDYQPGATATIYASGFEGGETVVLQVLHADGTPASGQDHEPWTVVVASNGTFQSTWHVCEDDCRGSTLLVSASGQTSGFSAQALFTDDTGTASGGTVWGWGSAGQGQLGNGSTVPATQNTPVQANALPGGRTVVAIAAGGFHSLALANDGTAWAWGRGSSGQLGNGGFASASMPVQVNPLPGGRTFVALAAGGNHSLAIANDGTAWAWGTGGVGQLGNASLVNSIPAPVQVTPLPDGRKFAAIAGSEFHSLALADDGSAWAWGFGGTGQLGYGGVEQRRTTPVLVSGGRIYRAIAAGSFHSLAIANDGTAWAWGQNVVGALGTGSTTPSIVAAPVQVTPLPDGRKFAAIAGGENHSLALADDGSAWAWGRNNVGQLGDGTFGPVRSVPAQVTPLSGGRQFVAISTRTFHNLAVGSDGTAWAWGPGFTGQLGNGSLVNSAVPVQVAVIPGANEKVLAVAVGGVALNNTHNSLALVGSAGGGNETTPPTITCPADITRNTDLGRCSAVVAYPVTAEDDSGTVTVACSPASGSTFPKGTTRVDCTATDPSGNAAVCSFNVTVVDGPPAITLNGAASVTVEACTGEYTELGATAISDCEGPLPVVIGGDTVTTAQPGTFVITYSATDSQGRTTTIIRVVTVQDTQPPVFTTVPTDLTVACGSGQQAAIGSWLASAAATDSCSPPVSVTHALQWLDACAAGRALVTWTATDARDHSRTTSANLTVEPDAMLTGLQFVDDDASLTMPRDTTQQINVTVRNSGACPLVIQSAQIAANFATPTLSGASSLPMTLCSGADATITLQVNSASALDGVYAATLTLQGPAGGSISLPVRITVSGRLWPDVALDFTGGGVSVVPASSPVFPVVGEAFTIHASVKNVGAMAAGAFTVKFFEGANLLGTQSVAGLGVSQAANVSLNIPGGFPEAFYLIRAEATSPEGGELRVDNNSSSALLQVGVPFTADAFIRVTASLVPACTVDSGTLSVHAEYVIVTEQAVLTHPVQGGRVDAIIQGTTHGVNNGHTDRDGNLSASIGLPAGGNYTLHVAVTDFTITGEEHFPITVPNTPNCAQGGVSQQVGNASPHYPPPEIADLYLCSSDLMFFAADGVTPLVAPPQPGQTVHLCANVHYYTSGGVPLNSQPVHFKAKRQNTLGAEDHFIGTTLANFAGGGATTVCVQWRVPDEGTFVVTVALAPTIVQLPDNDTTTRALVVGNPPPPLTVIHVTAEGAGCSPGSQWVSGRATYEQGDAFIQPVVCGQVTARAYDSNGVLLGTRVGPTTDSAGNFYFGPGITFPVGVNRMVVEVTDGTLTGSTEFTIECTASQNVPAPSTPPAAQGDLYLFSEHVAFLASDCVGSRSRNPLPGETISVAADIHYYDNYSGMPLSDVPVDINVIIPVGDTLQSFHIASTTVDFPFGGGSSVICSPWTPTVLGPQIIQVVIDSPSVSLPFADYTGNNAATRLISVGLQDVVLTAEPAVRHVFPGQSASYTIQGEVLSADHPTLNLSAHLDATTAPPGLGFTFGANSMTLPGNTSLTLTTATATPPGTYQLYVVGSGDQRSAVVRVTLIVDADATPPTLTLLGENPMIVECHSSFTDPGATAIDNFDGDLSANIIASGSVDVNLPVTYTVSYTVTDAAGNSAQTTRTVTVADTTAPAPNLASLPTVTGQCSASVTAPTATDVCDGLITATTADPLNYTSQGTFTVHWTYTDSHGNSSSQNQTVIVQDTTRPVISLNGAASVTVECHSAYADAGATASDNCDGDLTSAIVTSNPVNADAPGTYMVSYNVNDAMGNAAVQVTRTVTVINTGPEITSFTGPSSPLALGSSSSVTVNFTDAETQGHRCRFSWDDGSSDTEVVKSAGVGSASVSHTYAAAGVYTVTVTVTDDCGATAMQTFQYIVIYDPNGGHVTGGGWIHSPAGAYPADPSLAGKANFGFVSKYKNGTSVPEGQTEFQFHAGNFNFHSTSYQWLVVSGARAQYKGVGAINGVGSYNFLLTATDGQIAGGGGADKFRIKITDGDLVVYDNVPGASDDMDNANPQAIGGGSIVIHK